MYLPSFKLKELEQARSVLAIQRRLTILLKQMTTDLPFPIVRSSHSLPCIAMADDGDSDADSEVGIATKTKAKPKKPSQYKVLMLNDDYTPMEFVVMVLKRFFAMDLEQATRVMLHVHQKGVGVCGIFPYEVAETKVNQVMDFARQNQHPLQCTLEKA
jgi:ATP-dependent Clp protease adaptor protein ClpS